MSRRLILSRKEVYRWMGAVMMIGRSPLFGGLDLGKLLG